MAERVLVSGGTGGLGQAVCRTLAAAGFAPAGGGRPRAEAARELGGTTGGDPPPPRPPRRPPPLRCPPRPRRPPRRPRPLRRLRRRNRQCRPNRCCSQRPSVRRQATLPIQVRPLSSSLLLPSARYPTLERGYHTLDRSTNLKVTRIVTAVFGKGVGKPVPAMAGHKSSQVTRSDRRWSQVNAPALAALRATSVWRE